MDALFTGRVCSNCIMDESDRYISFDANGVCNHCLQYRESEKKILKPLEEGLRLWEKIVAEIKENGRNNAYDCVLGISGGVDSTYVAYIAKQFGLKCLLVHLDNGWNSELSVQNIENIARSLKADLYTYVIDWEEFRDLQRAYIKASVIDIEALTDHAITATLYKTASKHGIPYILSGTNLVTEGILGTSWIMYKSDSWNIKDIHRKYGSLKLRSYPFLGFWAKRKYVKWDKIKVISPLNFLHYNKKEAKQIMREHFDWRDYGLKHHESIFTRFYQGYILPGKFGVDKRKAHLSSLIVSGQMSREEALVEIQKPKYDEEQLKNDYELVLKKLGFTHEWFQNYLASPEKSHYDFATEPARLPQYLRALLKFKVYS